MDITPSTRQGANVDAELSQLALAAISLHEIFTSYLSAGFTEDQALRLLAYITLGSSSND